MLFAQLFQATGLNDVCDWLGLKSGVLARFGVTPPSKKGLSHANKARSAEFAEKLFWSVLGHLQHASPYFCRRGQGQGPAAAVQCQDPRCGFDGNPSGRQLHGLGKHRRRKVAAEMHLRLDLHSILPSFAIVTTTGQHDNKRAREVCATIQSGEIVVFDKAYVDFEHQLDLEARDVWWVSRFRSETGIVNPKRPQDPKIIWLRRSRKD
jgi:hypothetical protein